MALTLRDIIKEKLTPRKNKSDQELRRTQVINEILDNVKQHITEPGMIYRFEWQHADTLPDVPDAIMDPAISTLYDIYQEDETIFVVTVKEL